MGGEFLDSIDIFNTDLGKLINTNLSKLPVSFLKMALQNAIYQLEILKLQQQELVKKEEDKEEEVK